MMDLQLDITQNTQQLLQKEAIDKNLPISKLVSNLLENYFAARKWQKNQSNSKQILLELAQNDTALDMTEDELMDFINSEIDAYRTEKYAH
jgi:site-specific recombinase XerD